MKKTILKSALLAVAGIGLMAGSSMATPTSADFFTPVHNSTQSNWGWSFDNFTFAAEGGSFGLYNVVGDDFTAPVVDEEFLLLDSNSGIFGTQVFFNYDTASSTWFVDYNNDTTDGTDIAFSNTFGFYFSYGGTTTYTDALLNTALADPISIDYTPDTAAVSMDFINSLNETMTASVSAHDVAPVPEPATMLLFGTGLAGLAGFSRKRKKSQNA